jgi:uncharacterized protein YraI
MEPSQQHRRILVAAAAAALGIFSSAALAEDVVVKLSAVSVLSGKTARSEKVAQVRQGQRLEVVGREGSWLKVKVGDRTGYVHENSVGGSGGSTGGLSSGLAKLTGGDSAASSASSAEAGRGLEESAKWAQAKGMNTSGLDRMIALRNAVNDGDWQKFAADGKDGAK